MHSLKWGEVGGSTLEKVLSKSNTVRRKAIYFWDVFIEVPLLSNT